jgi:hypothetical protein
MPRLGSNMEQGQIGGGGAFGFSATKVEHLGASEYTLVTIAIDESSSVYGFADELLKTLITAVDSCKKSPRSSNLLVRVVKFSTSCTPKGVEEIHGFKQLSDINSSDYRSFSPNGSTPLTDAVYSSIGAMAEYGAKLMDNDFLVNGIAFIITDGCENASTTTKGMVKKQLEAIRREEKLESMVSVLIGINAQDYRDVLEDFKNETGMDQYIDAGDATPRKLAKLADFVSTSVSSQSQALGTGGPSTAISATI